MATDAARSDGLGPPRRRPPLGTHDSGLLESNPGCSGHVSRLNGFAVDRGTSLFDASEGTNMGLWAPSGSPLVGPLKTRRLEPRARRRIRDDGLGHSQHHGPKARTNAQRRTLSGPGDNRRPRRDGQGWPVWPRNAAGVAAIVAAAIQATTPNKRGHRLPSHTQQPTQ